MLKKKIIPVFLVSVLTVSGTTGFVTEAFSENVYAAEEVHTERLADFADLLDDGQEEELEAKLDQVSEDYGCDVVVVTEETLDGAVPQDYADDFFDYNDYGMGEDKSGILFLITMSERKWCISTHGEAIQIFTDAGQEYMTDNFVSYLSDGEYYEGFMKFADLCEEFIIQAQSGEPYDVENLPEETIPFYMIFLISLVVGFVIALIVTGVMRSRMKTVHMKPDAADYMKDGSLHINRSPAKPGYVRQKNNPLHRRDPPLQQRPAGLSPPIRRRRNHHPHRCHNRESILRSQRCFNLPFHHLRTEIPGDLRSQRTHPSRSQRQNKRNGKL